MANEFYIRKGLSIATMSVATASGSTQSTKYLVLGDDSIVRWATASSASGQTSGTSGTSGISGTSGTSGSQGPQGISAGQIYYFNLSATASVSGYRSLATEPLPNGGTYSTESLAGNQTGYLVETFLTEELGFSIIPSGTQRFHLHLLKGSSIADVEAYVSIQLTDSAGVPIGTVLSTGKSYIGWADSTTTVEVTIDLTLPTTGIDPTNRMRADIYLDNKDPNPNTIEWHTEGTDDYSYVITSVGVINGTSGTSGISGTSGTSGTSGSSGTSGTSFSGSGTNNYVAKWLGTNSLQDSNIQDDGYPNGVGVNYAPQTGVIFSVGNAVQPTTAYILNNYSTSDTTKGIQLSMLGGGTGPKIGLEVLVPTGANNYALKLQDGRQAAGYVLTSDSSGNAYWGSISGASGTSGTSGTSGSSGTSGTSGTSLAMTGNWKYDAVTTIDVVNPLPGGFAYWEETTFSRSLQPNLTLVNRIQLTKSTVEGTSMESWLRSLNGTGFTATYNSISYSYSKYLTKGYISIRNASNVIHNFKVVSLGWYSSAVTPSDRPSGTSTFNSLTSANDPQYWLAVVDDAVNNLMSIYVDYVGSTSYTSFTDADSVVISQSSTLPITVAQPSFSFQISDGQSPAGLDAFGLAINGRNSIHLNNYTRNIFGSTGSRDATVIGYNAGWTMSVATSSTFIGASAGAAMKTGAANTFIGAAAGMKGMTASNNVYVGAYSGFNNMKDSNVFIGANSGYNNNGNRNIFIGASAGSAAAASTVNNSIAIGFDATPTADNQLVIASSQYPLGTASAGVFSHYLNAKINGIDVKIPIYY